MKRGYEPRTLEQAAGHLVEECGELQQAIGKIYRFGLYESHPTTKIRNIDNLIEEMNDVKAAISRLEGMLPKL